MHTNIQYTPYTYKLGPLRLSLQIRTVCYGSQLVGGVLSRSAEEDVSSYKLGKSLLLFSAQLSHCRTVLRLFDDLSMLAYSHTYGFGDRVRLTTPHPFMLGLFVHEVRLTT